MVDHSGRRIARNSLINLGGQAAQLAAGLVALPLMIRGLGTDAFGAFQLAWVFLGYFSVFDLGLGRATTKFVAAHLGRGDTATVSRLVGTAVAVQGALGIVGGVALAALGPWLATSLFHVTPDLAPAVIRTFELLGLAVPIVLLTASFSGVLEAAQRFDVINTIRVPSSLASYLLPLVVLAFGGGLIGVVSVIIGVRVVALMTYILAARRTVPGMRSKIRPARAVMRELVTYGGWLTLSNTVSPLMVYLDRAVIGAVLGLTAVTYYAAPYEVVSRLGVVTASLVPTLFPAFSHLTTREDFESLERLFTGSSKALLFAISPIVLGLLVLARPGLTVWLGAEFGIRSALPLQILAVGMIINAMAQIPYAVLQGAGRPDLTAKFHLIELPFYAVVLFLLVRAWGIEGAAAAWALRVAADGLLLFAATFRTQHIRARPFLASVIVRGCGLVAVTAASALAAGAVVTGLVPRIVVAASAVVIFGALAWRTVLGAPERAHVRRIVARLTHTSGTA